MIKKNIKTIVLCIGALTLLSFSQPESEYILWGTRQITWEDFKGSEVSGENVATLTFKIRSEIKYITKDSLSLLVQNLMVVNESWTKTRDSAVLTHERNHFNLAEVYARKMRKAFSEKSFKFSTISKDIDVIYNSLINEVKYKQKLYDIETEHSKNRAKQLIWDKKIQDELNQLEAYSRVVVPLKVDWKK